MRVEGERHTFVEISMPLFPVRDEITVTVTGHPDYRRGDQVQLRALLVDGLCEIVKVSKRRRTTELVLRQLPLLLARDPVNGALCHCDDGGCECEPEEKESHE